MQIEHQLTRVAISLLTPCPICITRCRNTLESKGRVEESQPQSHDYKIKTKGSEFDTQQGNDTYIQVIETVSA